MVTEILLPTFRRVIPVCRTLESFPTGNARVHGLANLRGGGGGEEEGGGKKRKNSKVDFSRDRVHFLAFWFFLVWKSVTSPTSRDSSTSRTWIDQLPRVLATFPILCIRIYWMEKRRSLSKQFESISVDHIDIVYDWAKNYWPNYWSIK